MPPVPPPPFDVAPPVPPSLEVVETGSHEPSALQMPDAQSAPILHLTVPESAQAASAAPPVRTKAKILEERRSCFMAGSPAPASCCGAAKAGALRSQMSVRRQAQFCCSATWSRVWACI